MKDDIFKKFFLEEYDDDMPVNEENYFFDMMLDEMSVFTEAVETEPEDPEESKKHLKDDSEEDENKDDSDEETQDDKDPEKNYTKNLTDEQKQERDKKLNGFNKYFGAVKKSVRFDPTMKRYGFHLRKLFRLALILATTYILPYGIFVKVIFFITSTMIGKKVENKQRARLNSLYENKIKYYNDLIDKTNNPKKKFKYRQLRDEVIRNQRRLKPYVVDIDLGNNSMNSSNESYNLFLEDDEKLPPISSSLTKFANNEIKSGERKLDSYHKSNVTRTQNKQLRQDTENDPDDVSSEDPNMNEPSDDNNDNSVNDDNLDTNNSLDNDDESLDTGEEDSEEGLDDSDEGDDESLDTGEEDSEEGLDGTEGEEPTEDPQKQKDEHYLKIKYFDSFKKIRDHVSNSIKTLNIFKNKIKVDDEESLDHIINEFSIIEEQCNEILQNHITNLSSDKLKKIFDLMFSKLSTLIKAYKQLNIIDND